MLLPGVAIASNPVFSTVLPSLTEVPHWSLQSLGKSNEGQSLCFDESNSASLSGSLVPDCSDAECERLFCVHTYFRAGVCVGCNIQLCPVDKFQNKIWDV